MLGSFLSSTKADVLVLQHSFIAYFIFCRIPKQLTEKVFAKSMQKSEEPKETEDRGNQDE